ncbi:MAG: hypothetical protein KGH63_03585 [Candidatus Micrarchaeota archaeon]|nr:hypothetical protein [Candidatus Micrarchaeota archaeon]
MMTSSIRAGLALVAVSLVFLAFLGCTQSAAPGAPSNQPANPSYSGAVVPNVPAEPGQAPPVVPAGSGTPAGQQAPAPVPAPASPSTCTLALDKAQIVAGDSVGLTMRANPGPGITATYLCGSDIDTLGTNGLFNDFHLCQFNQTGTVTVWMALNGQRCASADLQVLPAATPSSISTCWITPGSRNYSMQDGLRTYTATVNYANYSSNPVLSWDCAWKSYQQSLGSGGVNGPRYLSGSVVINCQYAFDPGPLTALPVHVNSDYCGDILK